MNKEEHKILKLSARIAALTTISTWQAVVIRQFLSEMPLAERSEITQAMRRMLSHARENDAGIAFPELPPEMSDLWAAELQEALANEYQRAEALLDLYVDSAAGPSKPSA
jgi:hypothetical protein